MRHQSPESQNLLFHPLWLSQVLPAPWRRGCVCPRAPQMVFMALGWHMAGFRLATQPSPSIVMFCALFMCPVQRPWTQLVRPGWLLPWGKVLSLTWPVGTCPLSPGELCTHVGFRELLLCLPDAIARKMDRDLSYIKTGAPRSTLFL